MADILLSVGMQTGAAETSEFISQLQGIVNGLNNGKNTEIKMRPVVDSASMNELKAQLGAISSMVNQINQKRFDLTLNLDNSANIRERLGTYQEQVREYVRNVQEAYSIIGQVTKSAPIREMGTAANQYITPALEAIQQYGDAIGKLESRLDKTSTMAGAERIATDAQMMYAAIQPLIELARDKGVLSFGENDFKLPAMMQEAANSANGVTGILSSLIASINTLSAAANQFGASVHSGARGATAALDEEANSADKLKAIMTQVANTTRTVDSEMARLRKIEGGSDTQYYTDLSKLSASLQALRGSEDSVSAITSRLKELKLQYADTLEEANRFKIAASAKQAEEDEATRLQRLAAAEAEYYAKLEQQQAEAEAKKQAQIASGIAAHQAELDARLAAEERAIEASTRREIEAHYKAEDAKAAATEKAAQREIAARANSAAQMLQTIQSEIGKTQIKLAGETDEAKIEALKQKLEELNAEYEKLFYSDATNGMTSAQFAALAKGFDDIAEKAQAARDKQAAAAEKAADREAAAAEKAAQREANATAQKLQKIQSEINEKTTKLAALGTQNDAQKAAELRAQISELTSEYERLRAEAGDSLPQNKMDQLAAATDKTTRKVRELNAAMSDKKNWLTSGQSAIMNRLTYLFGMYNLMMQGARQFKQMVSEAVSIDTSLTQLQIVTNNSSAEMAAYAKQVSQTAKETAQSTKDLIDATTVYARLGYTMDESSVLARFTAMLQGVGDIQASDAQDAMTAIIKAFDVEMDDVESVMDKLVKVGNNFPISVSQLAQGMNNAGSMLAVAGNDLDQSIALLTAANTTVQDISKASTGLRTIAARIRKTTTEEDEDGVINEAKYQEMLNALTKQHVSLVDEVTGEYRSTYDVMKDIAAVWDELSSMEQAAVTEALAGTRQQNVFASLVTQFQEAENAMASMSHSGGALESAYAVYVDSIQGHTNKLKAAFTELSTSFINSDLAKYVIDAGTGIIEVLTKVAGVINAIVQALGPLGTMLTGGSLAAFFMNFGQPFEGVLISEISKSAYHGQEYAVMVA